MTAEDAPLECGVAEGLLAARAGGALPAAGEELLERHLASCAACAALARELEIPAIADALASAAGERADFPGLRVVEPENYARGDELRPSTGAAARRLRARDRRLGRDVTLVELDDARRREPFLRELRARARLAHAGIVAVHEAGCWPGGQAFFSERSFDGRPLDAFVAGLAGWRERAALLPALLTVADAVAHAHARGELHGDLGPDRVLLADFGEVVVTGWGRAPEGAAAGDDVRALGGMLRLVLDGARGRRGHGATALRELAGRAAAASLGAADLAAELRRAVTRQLAAEPPAPRRSVWPWLVAAGVAAAAAALIAGTVAQRDAADRRRRAAEELVDRTLGGLRERLEPAGQVGALAGAGGDVERYYAAQPGASAGRGRTLLLLAEAEDAGGDREAARAARAAAAALCPRLSPAVEAAACAAGAADAAAAADLRAGAAAAALAGWDRARAALDPALARDPAEPALRQLRARVGGGLGRACLALGRLAPGREAVQAALALTADPDVPALRAALQADLGDLALADGDADAAIRAYAAAADLAARQRALAPGDGRWPLIAARAAIGAAAIAVFAGDRGLARARLDPAVRAARHALAADAADPAWLRARGAAANVACDLEAGADAEIACRDAKEAFEQLAQLDPTDAAAARDLAAAAVGLSAVRLAAGDLAAARAAAADAVAIARGAGLLPLSAAEAQLAAVARAQGRPDEARAAALAAVAAAAPVAARGDQLAAELALARAELELGDAAAAAGRLARAAARWPAAAEVKELSRRLPR